MGLGMFTQAFTTGFVALRLPFPLTQRFKAMTQAGVGVSSLDTTYVSSTSWYMMTAFGVQRIMQLFNRGGGIDEARMMQMQMGMMPGMGGGQPGAWQPTQAFAGAAGGLSVTEWSPAPLLLAEKELLAEAAAIRAGGATAKKTQ